jgi:hypothetical protein
MQIGNIKTESNSTSVLDFVFPLITSMYPNQRYVHMWHKKQPEGWGLPEEVKDDIKPDDVHE